MPRIKRYDRIHPVVSASFSTRLAVLPFELLLQYRIGAWGW